MSVSKGSNKVFEQVYFVAFNFPWSLYVSNSWCTWWNLLSLGRGLIAQGYDPTKNSYNNRFQPYVAYWGAGWTLFFILINGLRVFWNFTAAGFLTACTCDLLDPTVPTLKSILQISTSRYLWCCMLDTRSSIAPSSGSLRKWTWSQWVLRFLNFSCFHLLILSPPGHSNTRRDRDPGKTSKEFRRTYCRYYLLDLNLWWSLNLG